ncbi:hypothetical protein [Capnocytophaga catalasegens]|nr:hypothetical protein [Capnocytophaga catalasegens]
MSKNGLKSENLSEVGAYTGGAFVGAFVSRVLHNKLPFLKDKDTAKSGIILALSVIGGAMANPKTTTGKLLQGMAIGAAATQANSLVKGLVKPKEDGVIKVGLGEPDTQYVYVEPAYDNGDGYFDYSNNPMLNNPYQDEFLSLPQAQEQFASV